MLGGTLKSTHPLTEKETALRMIPSPRASVRLNEGPERSLPPTLGPTALSLTLCVSEGALKMTPVSLMGPQASVQHRNVPIRKPRHKEPIYFGQILNLFSIRWKSPPQKIKKY